MDLITLIKLIIIFGGPTLLFILWRLVVHWEKTGRITYD